MKGRQALGWVVRGGLVAAVLLLPAMLLSRVACTSSPGGEPQLLSTPPRSLPSTRPLEGAARQRAVRTLQALPLRFEENHGQLDAHVRYAARGDGFGIFLTRDDLTLALRRPLPAAGRGFSSSSAAVLRMRFDGGAPLALSGVDPLATRTNYFLGHDPAQWHTGIANFGQVRAADVYPGVDACFHGDQGNLKFDLHLAPGVDPAVVKLAFDGAERIRVDRRGDLVLDVPGGAVRKPAPLLYQEAGGTRRPVDGGYRLLPGGRVGFRVGAHDPARPLVIDPTLTYATYLGGASNDYAFAVSADTQGNVYVTGAAASLNFPVRNAFQARPFDNYDAYVAKLSSNLATATYVTFLGGTGVDAGYAIGTTNNGDALLFGQAGSAADFPRAGAGDIFPGATFVARFSPDGQTLTYSALMYDEVWDARWAPQGNIYVIGTATAALGLPAARTLSPYTFGQDGFVFKLPATLGSIPWATYLGGNANEVLDTLAVDSLGGVFFAGRTNSIDVPTVNGIQNTLNGPLDMLVGKINAAGTAFDYLTYLGGSADESPTNAVADSGGQYWLGAIVNSADFPKVGPQTVGASTFFVTQWTNATGQLGRSSPVPERTGLAANTFHVIQPDGSGDLFMAQGTVGAGGQSPLYLDHLLTGGMTLDYSDQLGGAAGGFTFQLGGLAWHFGSLIVAATTTDLNFPQTSAGYQTSNRGGAVGDGLVAVLTDPFLRPDSLIQGPVDASFLGDGTYNTDATNQTSLGDTVKDVPAVYDLRIQNDGNQVDSFRITGPAGSGNWTVRYIDVTGGNVDVTSAVTSTGFTIANLALAGSRDMRLEVTPSAAVADGTGFTVNCQSASLTNPAATDVVRAVTTKQPGPLLDYSANPGFVTDGVEPNQGTIATPFEFQAVYTDPQGKPAVSLRLHVVRNGTEVPGSPFGGAQVVSGNDPLVGITYRWQVTGLTKGGTYTYFASATNGTLPAGGPMSLPNAGPVVVNTPPVASNPVLSPVNPLDTQDVSVSYGFADADGDTDTSTQITWTVGGTVVTGLVDPKVLPADRSEMGDVIGCTVRPGDGTDLGAPVVATSITVATRKILLIAVGQVPTNGQGVASTQARLGAGVNDITAASGGAVTLVSLFGRAVNTTDLTVLDTVVTADVASSIRVRVTDRATGNPVAGIQVVATLASGVMSPTTAKGVTDGTGEAQLNGITFGLGANQVNFLAGDAVPVPQPVTINAGAGNVSRANSAVAFERDPAQVPADGQTPITLVITVRDANNNPVGNLPASSFQLTSDVDLGIDARFDPSQADGVARATVRASRPGLATLTLRVRDPLNNQLVLLSDTLLLRVLHYFVLRLQPGLNLVGSPVVVEDPSGPVVWRNLNPMQVARYIPDTNDYRALNPVAPTPEFDVTDGRAFWVRTGAAVNVPLAGDPTATGAYTLRLSGFDWTLASLPSVNSVLWDSTVLNVSINDVNVGTLAQATDFVAPYAWMWNAARQQSTLVMDAALGIDGATNIIPAGAGFWLRRGERSAGSGAVGLIFDVSRAAQKSRAAAGPSAEAWALHLNAATGGAGSEVTVGVTTRLKQTLTITPPPVPAGAPVTMELVDPATGRVSAGQLDPTPLGASGREWRLRVSTPANSGQVTLTWPGANRELPAGFQALVTDLTNAHTVSLSGSGSMLYTPTGPTREFSLRIVRRTGQHLGLSLQAQPSRARSVAVTLTLTAGATVKVKVSGLSGTVVKQWSAGALRSGTQALAWNGLDSQGRRVPAGLYRLEAIAEDALGEKVIASTIVAVR
ncbi:MAG: SBBP repeat-containing protein [Armatimonadetes bacterium]|nr:SBBP repeat-containing protein [Armatimonadota bacterium]